MENASKALAIAGGVLLALLSISLLVLLSNSITSQNSAKELKQKTEQLMKFNREYESYNKKLLYGTDVITVVNKAIENNKEMDNLADINNRYFVNVVIETIKEYKTIIVTTNLDSGDGNTTSAPDATLKPNEKYVLGKEDNASFEIDSTINNFFNSGDKITTKYENRNKIVTYPAISDFKKAVFKCNGIEYKDGRVHKISFEEIQ